MKDTIKKQLEDLVDCKINKAAAATEANGVSWSEFVKRQATILRIKGLCQLAEQFGVVRKRESRGLRSIDVLASADSAESTSSSDDDMGQQEDEDSSTARTRRWTLARARMQGTTRSRKRTSLPTTTDAKKGRTQGEQAGQDRLAQLEKLVHGQLRQMHSQQRKLSELKSRVRDNEVQWETWLEGALE